MSLSSINPFALKEPKWPEQIKGKEHIEIGIGSSNVVVDGIKNVLSIPNKLILWNSNFGSGNISRETIMKVRDYLHENGLHDVYVSVNEYNPIKIWERTFTNPNTSLLAKCTVGVGSALIDTLTIPKLTGFPGDHYSPMSNSVHIFSNDTSIALHECGHAKDFNSRKNPTLYTLTRNIPVIGNFITIGQEAIATKNAIGHLVEKGDDEGAHLACQTLFPALSTYVWEATMKYLPVPWWVSFLIILGLGHILGRTIQLPSSNALKSKEITVKQTNESAKPTSAAIEKIVKAFEEKASRKQVAAPAA